MSTNPTNAATQPAVMDPLVDSLLDLSEYDSVSYGSPSLSPAATTKVSFAKPIKSEPAPASLMPTPQPMSGPSHQYDLYKQQTGIVPGALASTHAVNQSNSQIQGYSNFNIDFLGLGNTDDMFDFNAAPSQGSMNASDMDMEFDSPSADQGFFYGDSTINPSSIGGNEPVMHSPPDFNAQTSSVGRLWPGMHQQAALAKAQAQQAQQRQQQIMQQQQLQQRHSVPSQTAKQPQRAKNAQPSDPIVEQKITQLLNSMRVKAPSSDTADGAPLMNMPRPRKDEEDMDEDERLLASEEGKKLSSKERRQLRNKVSARAFRSRRKEYITQLEAEIANKVTENGDLRVQNRALLDENKRLSDLTRTLLSSPCFADFLQGLSTDPQQLPQAHSTPQQHGSHQLPKDVNPYAAQQQVQQQPPRQHIGMGVLPEQSIDYASHTLDSNDGFSFQPQVYALLETPEPATIDASVLSGKTSNFVGGQFDSDDEKVEMPSIEQAPTLEKEPAAVEEVTPATATPVDEEFENDPAFALYHDSAPSAAAAVDRGPIGIDTDSFSHIDIFGGIEPDKALARYELVDASEEEVSAACAMARVQRISASLESVMSRLSLLTIDL